MLELCLTTGDGRSDAAEDVTIVRKEGKRHVYGHGCEIMHRKEPSANAGGNHTMRADDPSC